MFDSNVVLPLGAVESRSAMRLARDALSVKSLDINYMHLS